MAQFGAGKNPPWARTAAAGLTQQMLSQGVGAQAAYNLAAQQNLQTQFQAQQIAAATMQSMQQQAMLPQPGLALPTSLASANLGAISYPTLKPQQLNAQAVQVQQPKQRVFTGCVTKLHDNFGFVDEDVFFQTSCVKGQMPKTGDRVLVEAQFNANMPFKWNATSVKVLNYQTSSGSLPGSKPSPLLETGRGNLRGDRNRSGGRRFDRGDQSRDRIPRRDNNRDKDKKDSVVLKQEDSKVVQATDVVEKRKRSKSPGKRESSVTSRRSRSPGRRRPRVVPRYVVQVPKILLNMKDASVLTLKSRYANMYIPSDFFNAEFPWHEAFPLLRPFQLGKPCTFHVLHKDVDRVGQSPAVLDPPDADHLYSAKVMLIACPSLDELYHKSCSLSQDPESMQENFVHPTRLINFLVGVKGKNEPIAIGGAWSPSLDGANPMEDPKVLIKTAIRTSKALTGINLSSCTKWYRVAEVRYLRAEETHKGKLVPARVETSVIYLPDVWSCEPTHLEWETLQLAYKKQLQKKLAQLDGKEDAQEEEEEEAEDIDMEKKDPTHFSELDPKSMKILDLRRELECRNISSKGLKSQLIARLIKQLKTEQEQDEEETATNKEQKQAEEEEKKAEQEMTTEEDEEKKKKEEEEKKKEDEKTRALLERRYALPDKRCILVHPNPSAKGGKFDCSVMSLSVLLDYRPEDNKEHSFEVSLFAELFNEMLMRDFGFTIYKSIVGAPEKPKEEKKEKKKDDKKESKDSDEPEKKKKKTDEKKEDKKDDEKKDDKEDKDEKKEGSGKDDDKKKEEKKKEKKKSMTVNPDLLLSCIYFDQNHTGYILDKDMEEIVHTIGLNLSRAQVKKLVQKVVSRDSFSYRALTDEPILEEGEKAGSPAPIIELDLDKLVLGNSVLMTSPCKDETATPSRRRGAKAEDSGSSAMVMHNGALLDIDSLLERLNKGEKSITDYERRITELEAERDHAQRDLKKAEEGSSKLAEDLKTTRHDLSAQVKVTSSTESTNRKYLAALVETQTLVQSLAGTITGALGDMATIKVEKKADIKAEVKTEPTANSKE
ncbi:cell division cycle and apoptosis regulator protein 1-like isoform X2 [Dreissena polymorpha]|uniref:cell division cycle and apoptosis regulator protein 1-like isoform X2 n=1 Tax=Dreissena polymorpha TaxID=45954 RepID=UPI0022649642|nr:cell division cycle and apoptosis regulator protein 1-like isoform X2 [Dreissena polymorpha]XP_052262656.1 cell division cycle and apoptosis regulator protein 1-like isoform X2 [Dreissena polymorpha]